MIIKDGLPTSIYVRDFGGVRLYDQGINIDDSTGLLTENPQDLMSVFTHSVLYNHLFQLIYALEAHGYDAHKGYNIIKDIIASYHINLTPEINLLNERTLRIKSLLKMRIYGAGYEYQYTTINNPLYSEDK